MCAGWGFVVERGEALPGSSSSSELGAASAPVDGGRESAIGPLSRGGDAIAGGGGVGSAAWDTGRVRQRQLPVQLAERLLRAPRAIERLFSHFGATKEFYRRQELMLSS
ncbi:uncharacterized protein EMH_0000490 [Eimeria mitis]|uniref:Uncharacterized protein n=1 Tax=Eimeria mitis TaxID=44415 RepID=U6KCR6_9EIME|nr:uncharacterized protein EMH_0000490 [Eimeria mitis]CDJ35815.1 hypothetical protein EMH_0000490 [Eimeria mitis]